LPNGTVLGWECNLSIELAVVQSRALTFDPGLVKKQHQKVPNLSQKRPGLHLCKNNLGWQGIEP